MGVGPSKRKPKPKPKPKAEQPIDPPLHAETQTVDETADAERTIPFSAEEDKISKDKVSPEERQIKDFTRTTFILFVVGMGLILIGGIMVIISITLFIRAGQLAPEVINAPRTGITQGVLLVSQNQNFFASFASDLGVYAQGLKPTNQNVPGRLLWQTGRVVPLRSTLNFAQNGVLTIVSPAGGNPVWTNEGQLASADQVPPPYQLFVSDEGALSIRSLLNNEILWQRPEPQAFVELPFAVQGGSQLFAEQHIPSEAGNYYSVFRSTEVWLYLYKTEGNTLIWVSPDPSQVLPAPAYRAEITVLGNLQITDEKFAVGWSSQTAGLSRSTFYFYEVLDRGAIVIWKRTWGENKQLLWDSSVSDLPGTPRYSLSTGESLRPGQVVYSQNLEYNVILTEGGAFEFRNKDFLLNSTRVTGNLVSMTTSNGSMVQLQGDGKTQQVVWSSNTPSEENFFPISFTISDNAELIWAEGSGRPITISSTLDHIGKTPIVVVNTAVSAMPERQGHRRKNTLRQRFLA